jgi:hypothetical protein
MSESAVPLSVNGLVMPPDFPAQSFQAVQRTIQPFAQTDNELYAHFAGAWNAISYRYLSLVNYGEIFTASLKAHGSSPPAVERYNQERMLFGFFSNGFSVFEAFFYGNVRNRRIVGAEAVSTFNLGRSATRNTEENDRGVCERLRRGSGDRPAVRHQQRHSLRGISGDTKCVDSPECTGSHLLFIDRIIGGAAKPMENTKYSTG